MEFSRAFQWYHLHILMSKQNKNAQHIGKVENTLGFVLFNFACSNFASYGQDVKANNFFDASIQDVT